MNETTTLKVIEQLRAAAVKEWDKFVPKTREDATYVYRAHELPRKGYDEEYNTPMKMPPSTNVRRNKKDDSFYYVSIEVDGFKCEVSNQCVFDALAKFESLAGLSAKQKMTFTIMVEGGHVDHYTDCPPLPKKHKESKMTEPAVRNDRYNKRIELVTGVAQRILDGKDYAAWLRRRLEGKTYMFSEYEKPGIELAKRIVSQRIVK